VVELTVGVGGLVADGDVDTSTLVSVVVTTVGVGGLDLLVDCVVLEVLEASVDED